MHTDLGAVLHDALDPCQEQIDASRGYGAIAVYPGIQLGGAQCPAKL